MNTVWFLVLMTAGLASCHATQGFATMTPPKVNLTSLWNNHSIWVNETVQLRIKDGHLSKLASSLGLLVIEQKSSKASTSMKAAFSRSKRFFDVAGGSITVNVVGSTTSEQLTTALESVNGVDVISCWNHVCSIDCPISQLQEVSSLNETKFVQPVKMYTKVGAVTSEGDKAMFADNARAQFGVDGTGVKVCVISDSYNCLGGASANIASGDLPGNVQVIEEGDCPVFGSDEGRAMLQIIHDVAPGSTLAFRAPKSQIDMANGILDLAQNYECSIIVDDIGYITEPCFQDGFIAQAADQAAAQYGVAYFTSAGNDQFLVADFPSGFVDSGFTDPITGGTFHQFGVDADGDPILFMGALVSSGIALIDIQWDQPFFSVTGTVGSTSDLDLVFVYDDTILDYAAANNIGGDPIDGLFFDRDIFFDSSLPPIVIGIGIELYTGPPPSHMIVQGYHNQALIQIEFAGSTTASICGHANAGNVAGVGAANYVNTPAFGVSPPQVEYFSSAGGTPILFDNHGNRYSAPVYRQQPLFTGPDGVATTFFGGQDGSGIHRFFGTSASAPHAAAVGALLLQAKSLTPSEVYSSIAATAVDMGSQGYDYVTGYGFIDALAAVRSVEPVSPTPPQPAPVPAPPPRNCVRNKRKCPSSSSICCSSNFKCRGKQNKALKCLACAKNHMSCTQTSDCCHGGKTFKCVQNKCVKCSSNGKKCTSDSMCCSNKCKKHRCRFF